MESRPKRRRIGDNGGGPLSGGTVPKAKVEELPAKAPPPPRLKVKFGNAVIRDAVVGFSTEEYPEPQDLGGEDDVEEDEEEEDLPNANDSDVSFEDVGDADDDDEWSEEERPQVEGSEEQNREEKSSGTEPAVTTSAQHGSKPQRQGAGSSTARAQRKSAPSGSTGTQRRNRFARYSHQSLVHGFLGDLCDKHPSWGTSWPFDAVEAKFELILNGAQAGSSAESGGTVDVSGSFGVEEGHVVGKDGVSAPLNQEMMVEGSRDPPVVP